MENKNFQISEQLATAVLNYLATKPYAEVYQLIDGLQKLQPVQEKEEPKKDETD